LSVSVAHCWAAGYKGQVVAAYVVGGGAEITLDLGKVDGNHGGRVQVAAADVLGILHDAGKNTHCVGQASISHFEGY
jgi:hypothetical protein